MRNTKQYRAYLMILLMMLNLFIFPFSFTVESTSIPTYIYAGGEDTNKVYQYFTSNLTKKTETADYGGYVLAITEDDTYVYAGGETTQKIYQYWKINLSKKAESADYGGTIRVIVQDSTYLYAGGEDIQKIYQYWKTNLSKKAESADYGGSIRALTQDTTYIYAGGGSTQEVHQYWKTNLTKKTNSSSLSGDINAITQDTNYIYASVSFLNGNVYQLWKTNLTEKTRTVDYGGILDSITDDDTYVYSGGATQQTIQQYWKSNMTMKTESADYGGEIFSLTDDDTYVYAGGETTQKIYQYWKINLSKKAESADYGGTIKTISGLAGGVEIISPTVITTVSTGVGPSNATVYGQLTNDGGGNCTVGFEYGTTLGYGNYTEIPEYNTNYSAPIGKSNVSGRTVAFSPDGRFLAVGMTSSPFFAIFKKGDINKTWYKLPDPAIIPTDAVYEITFSHNGSYMAVGMYQSPRLYIYKYGVINETYYKIPDVISIPTGTLTDLAFSWNSTYLAWAQSSSPYFYLYKFSSSNSTYYQIANPSGITGACDAVEFSHNITNYMIVTRASAPYFKIFKYGSVNHTFYMITDPVQPTGRVYSVAFSSNNSLIAYSSSVYPYLGFYKYGKTNGTYYAISSPYDTGIGTGYKGIDFSSDDKYIAIAGYRYNPVYFFKLNESTKQYYRLSYPSVQTAYNNYGNEVAFSKTSDELVAGTYGSPYLIIFSRYVRSNMTFKTELTDLRPATLYHYRAVANNSNGTVYGSDMTFTTTGSIVPVLTTNNATGVEETNATLNGTLNSCVPVRLHERYNLNNYRRVLVSLGEWYGQTFRVGSTGDNSSHVIKYVNLRLGRKAGESPGTVTAFLRLINETTNNPVGPNISIGTVNGNTFVENSDSTYTGSNAWVQINMTPCTLLPNTQYIIFIKSASVGLEWAETMTGLPSYFGREIKTTNQGSTYTNYTSYALLFEVYGEKIPSDTTVNFQYRNSSCVPYNIGLSSASGDDSYGQANMRLSKSYSTTGQTTVLVIYGYAELYNLPGHGVCLAKMGIYEGTTYITESKESTISDGYKGWVQFIFNSTTLLSQSTNYRIGIAVSSSWCGVKVPISASGDKIQTRGYSSGFPNPWTGVGDDGRIACLYLNVINIIVTVNQTKTSVGTFNQNVVSLLPGQLYHYRAVANNTNGTGYGSNKTFLTKPYGPLTNQSITRNSSGFTLAWTKSPTGNNTVIRGKIGSYPSSPTGDVAVYNGSDQTVNHFGLSSGDTWYYRAWSYKSWSGLNQYSDNYTQNNKLVINNSIVTTNDATGVEETNATLQGTLKNSFQTGEYWINYTIWGDSNAQYSNTRWKGQTFTTTTSGYLTSIKLTMYRTSVGNPGTITMSIRNTSAGLPTGIDLATATTNGNTLPILAYEDRWYNFSTPLYLSANTMYAFIIRNANAQINYVYRDSTPTYTGGSAVLSSNSGSTWTLRTSDLIFWLNINSSYCNLTFQYGTTVSYGTTTAKQIGKTGDSFSQNIAGLSQGQIYHYRAVANNTNGTGYGADKTFLTKPNAPTGLTATDINTNHTQHLTWAHGTGYNCSVVRVSTSGYPATPTSGTQAYNDTGTSCYYATPLPGQAYFYRAWEYANESGLHQFSDSYSSAYNLTKPNSPRNFTLNWTYDSLIPIGTSPDQIDITWIKGTGANRTVIVRKNNSYPTSITDGTLVYNGTGTNKLDTNLHVYVRYYYRAWSYTTWSGMNHYSNTGINLTLAETSNTTESLTTATTAHLYGYLITQPYTHQYRFNYGQGSYTTNTTTLYRNTTGVIQRNITGLTPGKLYQYRAYANDSNSNKTYGNKKYFLTRPLAPTNVNYSVYNSSAVNLTWTKGTGSNRTVIVMNHLHNPTSPTDGTIVYNGTGSYYHLPITPGTPYYCQAYGLATWTYNPTIWMFSGNGTNMTWTYLGVNCFNESKPTQALTFNIQFKDEYGQHTFTALGVTNTYILNISQIPTGADILIKVWATGYKERLTTIAVTPSTYYNLTFYLPPASTTTNGTGGGTTGDCVTRTATNSITVGNTTVDATITFSHPLNEMIQVERYNSSVDRTLRSYTDSKTITSNTNDVWIPLNHTKESIISVQVWNTTLYGTYGGWFPVPADKYTYVSGNNTIRINKTILNPTLLTITQGKVDYYYWGGGTYGAWQFVTETKYSYNTTKLIVNKTALDSFTTMLRVNYYWQDCPGQTITTPLYYCRVVETIRTEFSEFDRPVENAQVWFQTYINTTGKYVNVSTLLTDGNGYVTIYLLPSNLYQVIIRKTGYDNYRSDYIPPPATQYGQTTEKLFRVVRSGSTIPTINYTYLMQNITWSLLPPTLKQKGAITFTFTIASADNKIEWYNMTITFYNKTQRRWIQIFTQNDTNAGGGTITFTTPNVTGDYEVELWFKKTGYLAYQLFQTGSLRYTIYYISAWIKAIPDFVWYLVLVVIMIIIMGFCFTKLGTGLITGYIGLGVMAFGLLLKPDITVNGFSGWVIWAITFLIYTMGMFLWSRL